MLDWYHKAYETTQIQRFSVFQCSRRQRKVGRGTSWSKPPHSSNYKSYPGAAGKAARFLVTVLDPDGTCIRDYIHVVDLAQAHIKALENLKNNPNGKYNLGNGKGYSNLEVWRMVEKVTSKKVSFVMAPQKPGDPAVLVASSELAMEKLNWTPRYSELEDMIFLQPGAGTKTIQMVILMEYKVRIRNTMKTDKSQSIPLQGMGDSMYGDYRHKDKKAIGWRIHFLHASWAMLNKGLGHQFLLLFEDIVACIAGMFCGWLLGTQLIGINDPFHNYTLSIAVMCFGVISSFYAFRGYKPTFLRRQERELEIIAKSIFIRYASHLCF